MKQIIEKLLGDYVPNHSDYQIDHFIIGKSGDAWAQYKQCLREIAGRWDNLLTLREDLELFDLAGARPKKFWHCRAAVRIAAARHERKRAALAQSIHHTERELARLVALAVKLKKRIGAIDDEKRAQLEAASWQHKARRMAGIDLFLTGHLSHATMELLLALPDGPRDSVLNELMDPKSDPAAMLEIIKK